MNILINGLTLENAILTPLLTNCQHWQSKGSSITFIGNQALKRKIKKLNTIKKYHFIKLNHIKKITSKSNLITHGTARNILALKKIPQIKGKFDIIHSRSSVLDLLIFPFILKLIDPQIKWTAVFDNTVSPSPSFLSYTFFLLSLILLKKVDIIFTISSDLKKNLINQGFSPQKIIITGNGVEADLIKKAKKNPKHTFDAIFTGRINPTKGIYDLIKITKVITNKYPKFQLTILGSGDQPTQTKFIKTISKAGLSRNITLLGFQSGLKKFTLIKSSKIFIFPSYQESFGIALLEAVCCGLKSFTYNLPAYEKIYKNNEIRTFPTGNWQKMAQAIVQTLNKKDFNNPKGKLLLSKYSWHNIAQIEYQALLTL